jgi:UbiD family decarboxylase
MDELGEKIKSISSLRDFISLLKDYNQCITWPDEVWPEPDIRNISAAANTDNINSPAIIFDKIKGYKNKKLILGVLGSFSNLSLLLGLPKKTSIQDMFYNVINRWGSNNAKLIKVPFNKAPIHENRIENNINLYDLLPLYKVNEYDGGFYFSKASVVSKDPLDPTNFKKENVGIYRMQVHGPDIISLWSIPSHDIGRQILMAEKEKLPFKIAIMLGNHPAVTLFAATPIGYEESEYEYASSMMNTPLRLTESGNGLDILADSEYVLEAELLHNERIFEGPFGEFTGFYSGVRRAPVFKITAVSFRNEPIFENLQMEKGWTEQDTLLSLHTSAPIYAQLKEVFPEVKAVNAIYRHGLTAIIAVKNRMGGFAKSVAMRALGLPHGVQYLKNIILVDDFVDPFDINQVMWALSTRTRANDIMVLDNMAMIPLDPSSIVPGKGHHLIIDATSFVPPDYVGEAKMLSTPTGENIKNLANTIKKLQGE